MGLYLRGKQFWMDFRINGQRYREPTGTANKTEASYIMAKRQLEIEIGYDNVDLLNLKAVNKLYRTMSPLQIQEMVATAQQFPNTTIASKEQILAEAGQNVLQLTRAMAMLPASRELALQQAGNAVTQFATDAEATLNKKLLADMLQGHVPTATAQQALPAHPVTMAPLQVQKPSKPLITLDKLREIHLTANADNKSVKDDEYRWKHIIKHFGAETLIADITTDQVEEFKQKLREGRKPATVNNVLIVMKAAFNLAAKRKHEHQDPCAGVKKLKTFNERDRFCTPEEYKLVSKRLAKPETPLEGELRVATIVAYRMAMRLNEIITVTWDQVNLEARLLQLHAIDTKTGKRRTIPLASDAVEAFQSLKDTAEKTGPSDGVFSNKTNSYSARFTKVIKGLAAKHPGKFVDLHFHDLRHTALTNLRRAGVDPLTMRAISGHASMDMLARYNTIDDDDLRGAIDKLETK